ncbi:MAG: PH domain-containing protein [Rhizobiales bacterium]|nr:PH domain-containing protein [Hyphomicrobiales bacterium]
MSAALVQFQPRFVWWQAVCEGATIRLLFSMAASIMPMILYPWWSDTFRPIYDPIWGSAFWATPVADVGACVRGFIIGFGIVTLISVIGKWQSYKKTVYRLHPDRIVISERFVTRQEKELRFSAVTEVSLRRSVFQRLAGLGSVYVATVATGQGEWPTVSLVGASSVMASGVLLRDIPKSDVVYDTVRALMERSRPA